MTATMRFIAAEGVIYPFGGWHWGYRWFSTFEEIAFEVENAKRK